MIPNPTLTMLTLLIGASAFILIMLLPALLELKRPKDAGPRRIEEFGTMVRPPTEINISLVNIEEEFKLDQKILSRIAEIIASLPNMET